MHDTTTKSLQRFSEKFSPQTLQTPAERQSLIEEAGHLWLRLSNGAPVDQVEDLRIGICSTFAGEGSTTTAANIARFVARKGGAVALVEANLRHASLAGEFGLPASPGLWDLIEGTAVFKEVARRVEGVTVIGGGQPPHDFTNEFEPRHVERVVEFLQRHHHVTIVDAPPLSAAAETAQILREMHKVVLVVRANHTRTRDVQRSLETMASLGIECAGIVLNDVRYEMPRVLQRLI
jgi:Mrp family chromosome partitioning ATPase